MPEDLRRHFDSAARIAARAEIRDVRLVKSNFQVVMPPPPEARLGWRVDTDIEVDFIDGAAGFLVEARYTLTIDLPKPGVEDGAEAQEVAVIAFGLAGLFKLNMHERDETPTLEEITAYGLTTGQFALYPYARAYITDVTGRMGLPPLVMGVLRQPVFWKDDPEGS